MTDVVWINGKVENELSWNDGSAMDGFAAHNLPEEAGEFCLSANDIPGRLTVKQCLVEQAYACQVIMFCFFLICAIWYPQKSSQSSHLLSPALRRGSSVAKMDKWQKRQLH